MAPSMGFDQLLERHVGAYGRYQKVVSTLAVIPWALGVIFTMEPVFTSASPSFWPVFIGENLTIEEKVNRSGLCTCELASEGKFVDMNTTLDCSWEFDLETYGDTVVSQYGLVCSRSWLVPGAKSIFMAGALVGALLSGALGDLFGRRPLMLSSLVLLAGSHVISLLSPWYMLYAAMRFLIGFGVISVENLGFTLACELVGPKDRLLVTTITMCLWSAGHLFTVLVAYFVRSRVWLEVIFTSLLLPCVSFYWMIPESPRWLYSKGRSDEADLIIKKMAHWNKMDDDIPLGEFQLSTAILEDKTTKDSSSETCVDALRSRQMIQRSLVIFLAWMAIMMLYFGITLSVGDLGTDLYMTSAFSALLEVPCFLAIQPIMSTKLGHCGSLSLATTLAAVVMLVTVPLKAGMARTTLGLIGKTFATFVYGGIVPFTSELYPTSVRALGLGCATVVGRLGSILAPFIMQVGRGFPEFVAITFGGLCLISGISMLSLPETQGRPLPQSLKDAERMKSTIAVCWAQRVRSKSKAKEAGQGDPNIVI